MSITPTGSSQGMSAMAAGLRARLDATKLETALRVGGFADPALLQAVAMTAETADAITAAGAEMAQLEMLGSIVDEIA